MSLDGSTPVDGVTEALQSEQTSHSATSPSGDTATFISSMSELKEKAPKVHKAMMEGIAQSIIDQQNKHLDRMKEIRRRYS